MDITLKIDSAGMTDGLDGLVERKTGVKNDSNMSEV